MAEKGSQCVPVSGTTDFRQITGTFGVSLSGNFLPIQDGVREKYICAKSGTRKLNARKKFERKLSELRYICFLITIYIYNF